MPDGFDELIGQTESDGELSKTQAPAAPAENTPAVATPPSDETPKSEEEIKSPETVTAPDTSEEEEAELAEREELKTKYSKPEDKGDEWQIRAFREARKEVKSLAPIKEKVEKIGPAERLDRVAEFATKFFDLEVPISEAVPTMAALSPSRFEEARNHIYTEIVDAFPDTVIEHGLAKKGATPEQINQIQAILSGTKVTQPDSPLTPTFSEEELAELEAAEFGDLAKKIRESQKPEAKTSIDPKIEEELARLRTLPEKLTAFEEKERQRELDAGFQKYETELNTFYSDTMSPVIEGIRALGLAPAEGDSQDVLALKQGTVEKIEKAIREEFDGPDDPAKQTPEQKENRRLTDHVYDLLAKGDRATARDYIPIFQAKADLILEKIREEHLDLYNTKRQRTAPPKKTTRPEIVGGTVAGGAKKLEERLVKGKGTEALWDSLGKIVEEDMAAKSAA